MDEIILKTRGMFCEHCKRAVTDSLENLGGVEDIEIDLKEGTISLKYAPNITTLQEIKDAVTDEGYDVIG
ncbi:MAG: cation transporter [Treponema sp.]|nr:cation transporter [Treponema sp.]